MITVPASVTNALASSDLTWSLLVSLPGGYEATDNPHNLTYDGTVYNSQVMVLEGGSLKRKSDITADSYEVLISNVDQSMYQDYVDVNRVGSQVSVYAAFVDPDDYNLLSSDSVVEVYRGLLDSWVVAEEGEAATMTVRLTSHWSSWKVVKGRFTNTASQTEVYPGDTFFEYSQQEVLPITWGS